MRDAERILTSGTLARVRDLFPYSVAIFNVI